MRIWEIITFAAVNCLTLFGSAARIPDPVSEKTVSFIFGGKTLVKNELPYQINLRRNGKHTCSGVIVSSRHILIAAHCVEIGLSSNFSVVAGDYKLARKDGTEQVKKVSKFIIHEKYDPSRRTNDIAILYLSDPLKLNNVVKAISLPAAEFIPINGTTVITSGWSYTNVDIKYPEDVLQKAEVPILMDDECRKFYSTEDIADSMLCAGYLVQGDKHSCGGDDGGPLVTILKREDGFKVYVLLGLFSWTHNFCGTPDLPGVYTEISYFITWIQNNIYQ